MSGFQNNIKPGLATRIPLHKEIDPNPYQLLPIGAEDDNDEGNCLSQQPTTHTNPESLQGLRSQLSTEESGKMENSH